MYVSPNYVAIGYIMATNLNPDSMISTLIQTVAGKMGIPVTYLMGSEFHFNTVADNLSDTEAESKTDTVIFFNNNYRVRNQLNTYGKIDKTYPCLIGFFKEHVEIDDDPETAALIVDEMEAVADQFVNRLLKEPVVRQDASVNRSEYSFVPTYYYLDRHLVGGYIEFNINILGCAIT